MVFYGFYGFFNCHPHTPQKNNDIDLTQILRVKSNFVIVAKILNFIYFIKKKQYFCKKNKKILKKYIVNQKKDLTF